MKHPFYFQNTTAEEHAAIARGKRGMLAYRAKGTDGFLWFMAAFVAFAFLCRQDLPPLPVLSVQGHPVREVAYHPPARVTHDTPGQDSSALNLVLDWFN